MATEIKKDHLAYGIFALVVLLPLVFFPTLRDLYRLPKMALFSLAVTLLTWLWLFLFIQEKEERPRFPLALPLALYLVFSALSLTNAVNIYQGLYRLLQDIATFSLFWLVVNQIRGKDKIETILRWAIPSAALVSLIGIFQMWGGDIPGLPRIFGGGVGSTIGNKNMAAQYILLILPLPYLFLLSSQESKRDGLWAGAAAIITSYFIYTGTRAAWLGAIGGSAIIGLTLCLKHRALRPQIADLRSQIKNKRFYLTGILLAVILMNWVPPYFTQKWTYGASGKTGPVEQLISITEPRKDLSISTRQAIWLNTLEMAKDHPWLGVGRKNLSIFYPLYATKGIKDPTFSPQDQVNDAHNDYLGTLAETGIFGFMAFMWALSALALRVARSLSSAKRTTPLILTLALSLTSLLIEAFFDFPLDYPVAGPFFWLFAALLWVVCEGERDSESRLSLLSPRGVKVVLGLLAAASILWGATNLTFLRAEYHFTYGLRRIYLPRWQIAEAELKKAIQLNPTTYLYPFLLGRLYINAGRYQDSVKANLRSLSLHPNNINTLNNIGLSYAFLTRYEEAEKALKRALEIWPDHKRARNNLATIYAWQGRKEEAISLFEESLRRNPGDSAAKSNLELVLKGEEPPKNLPKD